MRVPSFGAVVLGAALITELVVGGKPASHEPIAKPSYDETIHGLPATTYTGNLHCADMGYDYGLVMDGCSDQSGMYFSSLMQTAYSKTAPSHSCTGVRPDAYLNLICSEQKKHGHNYLKATMTSDIDMVVMVKGHDGGIIYSGMSTGGEPFSVDVGQEGTGIHHMEWCFDCEDGDESAAFDGTKPDYSETRYGLPSQSFSGNPNCADFGYDYGWKDEGCFPGTTLFTDMDTNTQLKTGATCNQDAQIGLVDIECSAPDSNAFKAATLTPVVDESMDVVVIMKGGRGGTIYRGLQGGNTYTIDCGADRKAISHIEFCFECTSGDNDVPAPEPGPGPEPAPEPEEKESSEPDLPSLEYVGFKDCVDMGYDFGYQMEGCEAGNGIDYDTLLLTPFHTGTDRYSCQTTNLGHFNMVCSNPDPLLESRNATITPSQDGTIIVQADDGGIVYTEAKAGITYTLGAGTDTYIKDIEFCFRCSPTTPEERNGGTDAPTSFPTETPTTMPTRREAETTEPTNFPTETPTTMPTRREAETTEPTSFPTETPTTMPTRREAETTEPTSFPTETPTAMPTTSVGSTEAPTATEAETAEPTSMPTESPTAMPTTTEMGTPPTSPTSTHKEPITDSPSSVGHPTWRPTNTEHPTWPPTSTKHPAWPPTGQPDDVLTWAPAVRTGHPSSHPTSPAPTDVTYCNHESLACPDGTLVRRVPPDCEFEECPTSSPTASVSKTPAPTDAVACTQDVQECPDGSFVARVPPDCEFEECPTNSPTASVSQTPAPTDAVVCTQDVQECPDGSFVARVPPDCEFEECPTNSPTGLVLQTPAPTDAVVCTQDVQECPDGSFVARVPPDCEFEACTTIAPTEATGTPSTDSPTTTAQTPPPTSAPTSGPTSPTKPPRYAGFRDCEQEGYDFGFQMENCVPGKEKEIDSLDQTPFKKGVDQGACQVSNVGGFDLVCTDRDMNNGGLPRRATVTPSVDTAVIIQGSSGGVLYKDLKAGVTYTLDAGLSEPITDIEFCMKCNKKKTDDRNGSSFGDPHIKTWGGGHFDFHGGCDLVLVDSPTYGKGIGMRIHIRTKVTDWWSYIDSAVLEIGSDRLEVQGVKDEHLARYWVNGKPGPVMADGQYLNFTLAGQKIQYHDKSAKTKSFQLKDFSMETFGDFVRVNVHAKHGRDFVGAVGLMGSYPSGTKVGRDGKIIWNKNRFGMDWQVHQDEPMLFHNVDGIQYPQQCLIPSMMEPSRKNLRRRRLGEALSKEDAARACKMVTKEYLRDCIADVLATNRRSMASAYDRR